MEINGHRFSVFRQKANMEENFVEFIGDKKYIVNQNSICLGFHIWILDVNRRTFPWSSLCDTAICLGLWKSHCRENHWLCVRVQFPWSRAVVRAMWSKQIGYAWYYSFWQPGFWSCLPIKMGKWLPWAMATTTVCQQLLLKKCKILCRRLQMGMQGVGGTYWKSEKDNDIWIGSGKYEIRKSLERQEDVRTVSSWEILHEVRPGNKIMGNWRDPQQEQRRSESLMDAIRGRCDSLLMEENVDMWFTGVRFAGKCGSDLQSSELIFPILKFCQHPTITVSLKHLKGISEAVCIYLHCMRPVPKISVWVQALPAVTSCGSIEWITLGPHPITPDQWFVLQQVGFTMIWFWLSLDVQVSARPHTFPMAGQVTYSIDQDPSFPFAGQVDTWHH